uniref:Cilia- and flagella-associated protein 43 n=1 Tax=Knipowitschia caucasica TaxID=637954 RepID=A0AAV2JQE6_KNICA
MDVRWIQGFTNKDVRFVDKNTIGFPCGNFIYFFDLNTRQQTSLRGPGRGVSAFTANGNSGIFAFSPRGLNQSIFVHSHPTLELKSELKGTSKLDFITLDLGNDGPYLVSCSSLPDFIITVWNWESATPLCQQEHGGNITYNTLVFNPWNWLQMCAMDEASLIVWNIERNRRVHVLKPRLIELPDVDGAIVKRYVLSSHRVSKKLSYFGPEMPPSAIAGLKGHKAESIVNKLFRKARVTPVAMCWTVTSQLYVGCKEGFLLLIDPVLLSVSIVFNPKIPNGFPELTHGFQALAFHKDHLIAVGEDRVCRKLLVKEKQIQIIKTWELACPITTALYSPNYEMLLCASDMGQIFTLNPHSSKNVTKVLDDLCGDFVALAFSPTDPNICVTVRAPGQLQVWSIDGIMLSALSMQAKITSLACCPVAKYVALGTACGKVLFVDVRDPLQPRTVHQTPLYHTPVQHLVFDPHGNYLFTSAQDSYVYVIDPRPSSQFAVLGCTVLPSPSLTLSAQYIKETGQVKVLALCADSNKTHSKRLTLLSLPAKTITEIPNSVDRNGYLSKTVLNRYKLPQDSTSSDSEQSTRLTPTCWVKDYCMGSCFLALSPHKSWLASLSPIGILRVRKCASLATCVKIQCHSLCFSGVPLLSISANSLNILSANNNDGSLVCTNVKIEEGSNPQPMSLQSNLQIQVTTENKVLGDMMEWSEQGGGSSATTNAKEKEEDDKSHSQKTWLESRREAIVKEDNEKYSEVKKDLLRRHKMLQESFQKLICENESAPEMERLDPSEFVLDVEDQRRLQALHEEEVLKARAETEWRILTNYYHRDRLKKIGWDSLKVKGRSVKAFQSGYEVKNYPLRERTEQELEDLRRVEQQRRIEQALCTDGEEKGPGTDVKSSLSYEFDCSSPYMYNQFEVRSREQKVNQIILLQDLIYKVKTAFNKDFDATHKQKLYELKSIGQRNSRIKEIMAELGLQEEIFEPSLSDSECPEKLLTVQDSEITSEKYLTPEQKEEQLKKLEAERHLASKGNNYRDKTLDDMMGGGLQVQKQDILKMEIPPPEFVLTKPEVQWSEEENKVHKEYQKKLDELNEAKEQYRKLIESEIKKLQLANQEGVNKFDETMAKLFEKQEKCEMAVNQEELKIACLVHSLHVEEEMINREAELKSRLEQVLTHKDDISEEVRKCQEEVDNFQTVYKTTVAEDQGLDKEFHKEFCDVPRHFVDELHKLFKRRPRAQKMRAQVTKTPIPFKEPCLSGSMATESLGKLMKSVDEMDSPQNMPEKLHPAVWERFCIFRRNKLEKEHEVKMNALTLAEMIAFLQARKDEEKAVIEEYQTMSEELKRLHQVKNRFIMDLNVQVLLKQGQVEVSNTKFSGQYADSILLPRSVVEDLNRTIRTIGESKISAMVERKNLGKDILQQEWELKRNRMHIEDLENKARDIQTLRISADQKEYLNSTDREGRASKQVAVMEKTLAYQKQCHLKNVEHRKKKIKQLKHQAKQTSDKTAVLETQIAEAEVRVAAKEQIQAIIATDNPATEDEERYLEIVQRSQLKALAEAQTKQLELLRAEVERLRNKNFPSLSQLPHN